MPASKAAGWSDRAVRAFGDYAAGSRSQAVRTADLSPQLSAREFSASLNFGKREFSLDDMTGDVQPDG